MSAPGTEQATRLRFTSAALSRCTCPAGEAAVFYWDSTLPGFGILARSTGHRSWVAQYRVAGRSRRVTMGDLATVTLAEAREKAREVLALAKLGHDPQAEKLKARAALTVLDVIDGGTSGHGPFTGYLAYAQPRMRPSSAWQAEHHLKQQANPSAVLPAKKSSGLNAELWGGTEYPPTYADKIADRCAVVRLVRDTQGNVDQPTWYRTLGIVAFCEDADQIAQEWSCGHPQYNPDEVAEKLEQAKQFKPTTCAKLAECQPDLCAGCAFNGKLASPIRLGMVVPELPPTATAAFVARSPRPSVTSLPAIMSETQALEQITGDFNGHLEAKSLLVVNEVTFAGDHAAARKFKSIVTEAELLIHHKFQRPYSVPNGMPPVARSRARRKSKP